MCRRRQGRFGLRVALKANTAGKCSPTTSRKGRRSDGRDAVRPSSEIDDAVTDGQTVARRFAVGCAGRVGSSINTNEAGTADYCS